MRLSVIKSDRGYHARAHDATVLLDNQEVEHCVTADEEGGFVVVLKHDQFGKPVIDPMTRAIQEITLRGFVRIFTRRKRYS